jgi:hypothetical protein
LAAARLRGRSVLEGNSSWLDFTDLEAERGDLSQGKTPNNAHLPIIGFSPCQMLACRFDGLLNGRDGHVEILKGRRGQNDGANPTRTICTWCAEWRWNGLLDDPACWWCFFGHKMTVALFGLFHNPSAGPLRALYRPSTGPLPDLALTQAMVERLWSPVVVCH